jgi:hypothetical protein
LVTKVVTVPFGRNRYEDYSKIKLRLAGKKNRIENKTFLYGTVTYITALLLHIVSIHI